jgi:processive 1,2-diacylglycerol beta-glucosyltransferase
MPGEVAAQLVESGVPPAKILLCGVPIDPSFGSLADRAEVRARLGVEQGIPMVLVLFGGGGHGKPRQIVAELEKVASPFQAVFITGRNQRMEEELRSHLRDRPTFRVLGWVSNMHEWLAAADLLVSKPGGMTITEAINSGVPLLALDPLPGAEVRACALIEKWGVGFLLKRPEELAPAISRLLANRQELDKMRARSQALARPHAARETAAAILERWQARGQTSTKSG